MSNTGDHDAKPKDSAATHAAHRCQCGDRALSDCPGEWEPGCDLGNNERYARGHVLTDSELSKLRSKAQFYADK